MQPSQVATTAYYYDKVFVPLGRLFTVFFIVPGALLVLLAGISLYGRPLSFHSPFHHARPTPA
jgi:hypothetical protein